MTRHPFFSLITPRFLTHRAAASTWIFHLHSINDFREVLNSMSISTLLITLALTLTEALAAPVQHCDISHMQLSLPSNNRTAFSKPSSPLTSLVLGVGVQNYTCSTAGTYTWDKKPLFLPRYHSLLSNSFFSFLGLLELSRHCTTSLAYHVSRNSPSSRTKLTISGKPLLQIGRHPICPRLWAATFS